MSNTNPATSEPKRSVGRTIARNTVFGLGAQLSLKVVSFIFQVLVINNLGSGEYGRYQIVLAWTGLFNVLGDLGISQYYNREVSRDAKTAIKLFWDIVVLRVLLAIVASAVTILGALWYYPDDGRIIVGISIFTLTYFMSAFYVPLALIISGNERVDITSMYDVISQVIFITAGGLFLYAGKDFVWLIIAGSLNIPLLTIMSYRVVRRSNLTPPRFHINPSTWWHLIKRGIPFGFIQLASSLSYRADTIILSGNVSNREVGLYNVAYSNLVQTLLTVARAFNNAIGPTLTREYSINPDNVRPWYFRSVKMFLFLGIPLAVGGMLTANKVVALLFKPEIQPAAVALAILVWDIPFVLYQSFCGTFTRAIRKEVRGATNYATLAVANLVLNLFLVPRFGIIGASFTTVLTDMIGSILFYILLRKELGSGLGFKRLIRIPISAGIMGVIIYLMQDAHLFIVIPVAIISYFVTAWLLGVFSTEERQQLTGLFMRPFVKRAARS